MNTQKTTQTNQAGSTVGNLATNNVQMLKPKIPELKKPMGTLRLTDGVVTFTDESGVEHCKIMLKDLTAAKEQPGIIQLYMGKVHYVFAFPGWKSMLIAVSTGSLIGLGAENSMEKKSGSIDWMAAIRQLRPELKFTNLSSMNSFKWVMILVGVPIILVLISMALTSGN